MSAYIPVSIGEFFDKWTMLKVEFEKITFTERLEHIKNELDILTPIVKNNQIPENILTDLLECNKRLWTNIEDIRRKESCQEFDDEFIQLLRNIYLENNTKTKIMGCINGLYHRCPFTC